MILPYDVNAYISSHPAMLATLGGYSISTIAFVPLNDAEPCVDGTSFSGKPFISYYWFPGILSPSRWFLREDRIRYHVLDRDYDRGMNIQNTLVRIFNVDLAGGIKPIPCSDNQNRIDGYRVTNSRATGPNDPGGLADFMVEVEFQYVTPLLTP